MDLSVLVLFLFLLHCQAEGDVKEETLYVKTGTDLLLDVGEPVTINMHEFMFWKFQSEVTIVRLTHTNEIIPNEDYPGKAELFPQNQSLLLKNVQKTDSGEYTAGVFGNNNKDVAQYQVTVVDPVSDVKLEVKQCSSDRSDLTLTCTTLDALLSSTFICENTTCSHEGGEPVQDIPPGASMKVYLKDGSVTCHHSNQVSSTEDTRTTEDLCRKGPGNSALIAIIVVILLVACVAAAVVYNRRRRKQRGKMDVVDAESGKWRDSEREPLQGPGPINDAQGDALNTIYSMTGTPSAAPSGPPVKTEGSEDPGYGKPKASRKVTRPEQGPGNDAEGEPPNTNSSVTGTPTAAPSGPPGVTGGGEKREDPPVPEGRALQRDTRPEQGPGNDAEGDAPNTNSSMTGTPSAAPSGPPDETTEEEKTHPPGTEALQKVTCPELKTINDAEGEPRNTNSSMTGTPSAAPSGPPGETEEEEKTGPAEPEEPLTSPVQSSQRKTAAGAEAAEPRRTEELQARRGRSGSEKQMRETKALQKVTGSELKPGNDAEGDPPNVNSTMTGTPSAAPSGPPGKTEEVEKTDPAETEDSEGEPPQGQGSVDFAEGEPPNTNSSMTGTPTAAPSGPPGETVEKTGPAEPEEPLTSPVQSSQRKTAAGAETAEPRRTEELQACRGRSGRERQKRETKASPRVIRLEQGPSNDAEGEPPNTNSSMTGTPTAAPSGPPGETEVGEQTHPAEPKVSQGDLHQQPKSSNGAQGEPPNTNSSMTETTSAAPSGPQVETEDVETTDPAESKASQGDLDLKSRPSNDAQSEPFDPISSVTETPSAAPSGPPGVTEEVEKTGPAEPEGSQGDTHQEPKSSNGAQGEPPNTNSSMTGTPTAAPSGPPGETGGGENREDPPVPEGSQGDTHQELKQSNGSEGEPPNTNSSMTGTPTAAPSGPPVKTEGSEDPGYGKPEVPLTSPVQSSQRKTAAGAETAEPIRTEELQACRGRSGRERQKRQTKASQGDTCPELKPSNDAEDEPPNTNSSVTGTPTAAPSGPQGETEGGEDPAHEQPKVKRRKRRVQDTENLGIHKKKYIRGQDQLMVPKDFPGEVQARPGPIDGAQGEYPNTNSTMTGTPTAAPSGPPDDMEVDNTDNGGTEASQGDLHQEPKSSNGAQGEYPNTNSSMTGTPTAAPSGPPDDMEVDNTDNGGTEDCRGSP